jgi:hypothetical protein
MIPGADNCPRCNATLGANQRFCPNCGLPLVAEAVTPPITATPQVATSNPNQVGRYVGVTVVVLVLLGGWRACGTNYATTAYSAPPAANTDTIMARVPGCGPNDFKITQINGTVDYSFLTVVGVVVNNCNVPEGVELQLTQYGSGDKVLDTDQQWPASVSNIAPHGKYTFKLMVSAAAGSTRFSVQPTDARQW